MTNDDACEPIKVGGSYTCKQCGEWEDGASIHECAALPSVPALASERVRKATQELRDKGMLDSEFLQVAANPLEKVATIISKHLVSPTAEQKLDVAWECPKCGWRKVQSVACEQCHAWMENISIAAHTPTAEQMKEALEGMVAAFDADYYGDVGIVATTRECALSVAKQALGWQSVEVK